MEKKKLLSLISICFSVLLAFVMCLPAESYALYDDTYYNDQYHRNYWGDLEAHNWYEGALIQKATIHSYGKSEISCTCGAKKTRTFAWQLDEPDSYDNTSYNIVGHTTIFPKTKKVTVWLDNPVPGSFVKLKIGKKTYKKKVGYSSKVKIKIKKPKYGKSVSLKVVYKGRVIGNCYYEDDDFGDYEYEEDEIVYYAKNIKKGMTKKQVKCLYYWGPPQDTASGSGNWSYWYYDDGSEIGFKNGKVRYWYDAAD